ncbi:Imm26 family immunity protein [Mesorhizobium sp. KR9-304]|uniref:Imm26 family immunity protein n=1 Tax=Mesorhizobium sp. KR9-304 TaxID=3156614 RepID=UPI0032B3283C
MGIRAKVGDVFLISLDERSWALGQLVSAWNDELYVAIFGQKLETQEVDPKCVIDQEPVFLALTLDAKLFHGDWPILGNVHQNLINFPQPAFTVRQAGVVHIESRDRTVSRAASPSEAEILRYRSVSSPAVIEETVRGYFGACEWNPHFEKFYADYAFESSRLLAG